MADADPKIQKAPEEAITIAPVEQQPAIAEEARPRPKRNWVRPLLMFGVPLVIIGIAAFFWLTSGGSVSTDNAYVQQDKTSVSSDVGGRIVEVGVSHLRPLYSQGFGSNSIGWC